MIKKDLLREKIIHKLISLSPLLLVITLIWSYNFTDLFLSKTEKEINHLIAKNIDNIKWEYDEYMRIEGTVDNQLWVMLYNDNKTIKIIKYEKGTVVGDVTYCVNMPIARIESTYNKKYNFYKVIDIRLKVQLLNAIKEGMNK